MITADETFDGTFPFSPHFSEAPGFRMHYVDEGDGEPIVYLHGEPTWGYLYRKMIPPLASDHRVVVPDHMGFGKSETPADRDYTLSTHVENLEALLVRDLDLGDITFFLQDWGGPIGGAFTVRNPERVKRLVIANTILPGPPPPDPELGARLFASDWFRWITRAQEDGTLETVLGSLSVTILSVMKLIGFENMAAVDESWLRAYAAPFATKEDCRGAIAFPLDVVTGRAFQWEFAPQAAFARLAEKPAILAEGLRDRAIPPDLAIDSFRRLFPGAPVVELPRAGHFCQEDAPETLVALIEQFVQTT